VDTLNLNLRAARVARELADQAPVLGASLLRVGEAAIIDVGVTQTGSLAAGVMMARIAMADLADLQWSTMNVGKLTLPALIVNVHQPVASCMASQYAGWQISIDKFFAMGSGPMRAAYGREALFDDIGLREEAPDSVIGVLETSRVPNLNVITYLAEKCRVNPAQIILVIARTASLAGGVQIVARSVETAMHKLHTLGFDLSRVVGGFGAAPLPPVSKDDLSAIGRTNDAVLYGSSVTLHVRGDDESLAQIVAKLPSSASRDYGRPFGEIFAGYDHDFYKIDPLLFSPAAICLQNIDTGRSHHAGQVNETLLEQSFLS
jgi:methenyltetrahydromethanopterin cyclohydrolase